MTAAGSTSLRFGHPEAADRRPGLSVDVAGRLATVSGDDAVRQSLLMLLSTRPGERVMRPSYGCPLHRLVFEPLDATTAGLAIHYVEQAVRRHEPRVVILAVDAGPSPLAPERLEVTLEFRVRASGAIGSLTVAIDLSGAP